MFLLLLFMKKLLRNRNELYFFVEFECLRKTILVSFYSSFMIFHFSCKQSWLCWDFEIA